MRPPREAVVLRKTASKTPYLFLGYVFRSDYDDLINYRSMHAVFEYHTAKALSDEAVKLGKTAKIHIKLDTGMGRIGMPTDESIEETQNSILCRTLK